MSIAADTSSKSLFDRLEVHILATGHAHAKLLAAAAPLEAIASLSERRAKLRDAMYLDAVALAHRTLLDGDRIAESRLRSATRISPSTCSASTRCSAKAGTGSRPERVSNSRNSMKRCSSAES